MATDRKEVEYDRMSMISEASLAVAAVDKSRITEVKSMCSPPVGVKDVLSATCLLLGSGSEWRDVQKCLGSADFQKRIANLDFEKVPPETRKKAMELLSKYNYEQILKVNMATGAFYQWAVAVAQD